MVNEDPTLRAAIEAHVSLQHQRVRAANDAGDDLPDSFPLDPDVFEYVYPRDREPEPVRALSKRIAAESVGVYRGCFLPGREQYVLHFDTDGDQSCLCVLSASFEVEACACLRQHWQVRWAWLPLEELIPWARSRAHHPALWP